VTLRRLTADEARKLLLDAQGLLDDPTRASTSRSLERLIRRLGFVQVDSIQVIERAHHLTLAARLYAYRPAQLERLLERKRSLFEHWTHDAAVIPSGLFRHWKPRFARYAAQDRTRRWLERRVAPRPEPVVEHVLERIGAEGPLMSKDFEHEGSVARSAWWGWKPQRAALEYLWRCGRLSIAARRSFHKVYDLTDRVHPELHSQPPPDEAEQLEWACSSALERLGVATPGEIAAFWNEVSPAGATDWCRRALERHAIAAVEVESTDGSKPRRAFAVSDFERRLGRAAEAPDGIRLLSPFDPVIRDRKRLARLFGFEYRFEAFVPARQRRHGYYVLPVLEGEQLIGRLDPKHHRERGVLEVRGLWWEPGVKPTKKRMRELDDALARLAALVGASAIELPVRG